MFSTLNPLFTDNDNMAFIRNAISEPSNEKSALPVLMSWRWFGARALAPVTLNKTSDI